MKVLRFLPLLHMIVRQWLYFWTIILWFWTCLYFSNFVCFIEPVGLRNPDWLSWVVDYVECKRSSFSHVKCVYFVFLHVLFSKYSLSDGRWLCFAIYYVTPGRFGGSYRVSPPTRILVHFRIPVLHGPWSHIFTFFITDHPNDQEFETSKGSKLDFKYRNRIVEWRDRCRSIFTVFKV